MILYCITWERTKGKCKLHFCSVVMTSPSRCREGKTEVPSSTMATEAHSWMPHRNKGINLSNLMLWRFILKKIFSNPLSQDDWQILVHRSQWWHCRWIHQGLEQELFFHIKMKKVLLILFFSCLQNIVL